MFYGGINVAKLFPNVYLKCLSAIYIYACNQNKCVRINMCLHVQIFANAYLK